MSDISTSDAIKPEDQLVAANDHVADGVRVANGPVAPGTPLSGVTVEALKETLQAAGFRVDALAGNGTAVLRSATSGLPFEIRLVNALVGSDSFADITFITLFTVNGAFPHDLLNQWNRSHRFARLFLDRPDGSNEFLVLCMDLSLIGGVSNDHLRTQIVIWDALVQQLVAWLRVEIPRLGTAQPGASEQAGAEGQA